MVYNEISKANKRQKHKGFMSAFKGQYWKDSPNKEWADDAKESFERLSRRELNGKTSQS